MPGKTISIARKGLFLLGLTVAILAQTTARPEALTTVRRLLEYSRFAEAAKICHQLLLTENQSMDFYIQCRFLLVESLERSGKKPQAIAQLDTLESLLQRNGGNPTIFDIHLLRHQGRISRLSGNAAAADSLLQAALIGYRQINNGAAEIGICLNELGTLALRAGDTDRALRFYRDALGVFESQQPKVFRDIAVVLNHIGLVHMRLANPDSTDAYFETALQLLLDHYGERHYNSGMLYGNMGIAADMRGDHLQAEKDCQKALAILRETVGEEHPLTGNVLNTLGVIYKNLTNYDAAIKYYQQSLRHRQRFYPETDYRISQSYQNIGTVHLLAGDYALANDFYLRALDINKLILDSSRVQLAWNYKDLGRAAHHLGKFTDALKYYDLAIAIYRRAYGGESHGDIALVYRNIGNIYLALEKPVLARQAFDRDLQIQKDIGRVDHPNIAGALHDIAASFIAEQRYEPAQQHLTLALRSYRKLYGARHPAITRCLLTQARIAISMGNAESALGICNRILNTTTSDSESELRFRAYLQKGRIFAKLLEQHPHDSDPAIADSAITAYRQTIESLNNIRYRFSRHRSKLVWGANWESVYMEALAIIAQYRNANHQQQADESALFFLESGTAMVLQEIVWDSKARQVAGVPDSLLERERFLGNMIASAQNKFDKLLNEPAGDQLQVAAKRRELQDYRRQYQNFIKRLERQFPKYFQLKYRPPGVSISQLQASLHSREVLLHYAIYQDKQCILAVSDSDSRLIYSQSDTTVSSEIADFLGSLKRISQWPRWYSASSRLYNQLIGPVESFLHGKDRLVIIPGGELTRIPFEALITGGTTGQPQYLLHRFDSQYHYSAKLFQQSREEKISEVLLRSWAGFAPVFGDVLNSGRTDSTLWPTMISTALKTVLRSGIQPLPASLKEVETIRSLFDKKMPRNDTYLLHRASKRNFLQVAGNYQYLHLATHGRWWPGNPAHSGIFFSEAADSLQRGSGILHPNEVYGLRLNARLAVLSSCESGEGEYVPGEGIMAISRGFFYAGSDNLLVSLWQIPDKKTASIMISFYQHLLAGKSLASALRQAKLEAISAAESIHPSIWSSFILIGGGA